jgi:hypothetical protein
MQAGEEEVLQRAVAQWGVGAMAANPSEPIPLVEQTHRYALVLDTLILQLCRGVWRRQHLILATLCVHAYNALMHAMMAPRCGAKSSEVMMTASGLKNVVIMLGCVANY